MRWLRTYSNFAIPKTLKFATAGVVGIAIPVPVRADRIVSHRQLFGAHCCVCCSGKGDEESKE